MQTSVLFALLAAAAVSATYDEPCSKPEYKGEAACAVKPAPVYGETKPQHRLYDCDATSPACYAPGTYEATYTKSNYGYKYGKSYKYPGPKVRFCNKLRRIKKKAKHGLKAIGGAIIGGVKLVGKVVGGAIGLVFGVVAKIWISFVTKWNTWCGQLRSDWERFQDWKACKAQDWKDWWEHYLDLCRTRKALWDDAMREFHRQWHHYKKCAKAKYEEDKKNKCKEAYEGDNKDTYAPEPDYDDLPEYREPKQANYFGVTPVEQAYNPNPEYKPAEYKKTCEERDKLYKEEYGDKPADVPDYEYQKKYAEKQ